MSDLTNILPPDRARKVRADYFLRLGTTCVLMLAVLAAIHAALLAPSYIYLSEEVRMRTGELEELTTRIALSEAGTVDERLRVLSEQADILAAIAMTPEATAAVRQVLELPRTGVRITGVAVSSPDGGEGRMSVSGVASTRESLRRFHDALSGLPSVARADLPLSVYAAEKDLAFTVQITGMPTP